MEPASKKDTLPQKPNTEEIRELLPEFNGSSALSLLEAKDTWERILVKADIHKILYIIQRQGVSCHCGQRHNN